MCTLQSSLSSSSAGIEAVSPSPQPRLPIYPQQIKPCTPFQQAFLQAASSSVRFGGQAALEALPFRPVNNTWGFTLQSSMDAVVTAARLLDGEQLPEAEERQKTQAFLPGIDESSCWRPAAAMTDIGRAYPDLAASRATERFSLPVGTAPGDVCLMRCITEQSGSRFDSTADVRLPYGPSLYICGADGSWVPARVRPRSLLGSAGGLMDPSIRDTYLTSRPSPSDMETVTLGGVTVEQETMSSGNFYAVDCSLRLQSVTGSRAAAAAAGSAAQNGSSFLPLLCLPTRLYDPADISSLTLCKETGVLVWKLPSGLPWIMGAILSDTAIVLGRGWSSTLGTLRAEAAGQAQSLQQYAKQPAFGHSPMLLVETKVPTPAQIGAAAAAAADAAAGQWGASGPATGLASYNYTQPILDCLSSLGAWACPPASALCL